MYKLCPGVHVEPSQLAEEKEPLCCDGVNVLRPGQVLGDVNPKEPEAVDSLHHSPVDGDGCVLHSVTSYSPQSATLFLLMLR